MRKLFLLCKIIAEFLTLVNPFRVAGGSGKERSSQKILTQCGAGHMARIKVPGTFILSNILPAGRFQYKKNILPVHVPGTYSCYLLDFPS